MILPVPNVYNDLLQPSNIRLEIFDIIVNQENNIIGFLKL